MNVPSFLRILKGKGLKVPLKDTKADKTLIFVESIEDHDKILSLIIEKGLNISTGIPPTQVCTGNES